MVQFLTNWSVGKQ